MPNKSILFVDDEKYVLNGLFRSLHKYRDEWNMYFANSGHEALELIKLEKIDILVTDMQMPNMSSVQLIEKVKQVSPKVIHIVLSGHSEKKDVLRSASF